ncbi:MAG: hypothetical protein OXE04_06780 [bacterium]|nr:hypothetical protein [bacterium]MCY4257975.1 hypothetical protein [bacterium]
MSREPTLPHDQETVNPKIRFPYVNLEEALHLVNTIHTNNGSTCELAQLAAWLGTTLSSSKFRLQISAAKMFGLIEARRKEATLTALGKDIVDPMRQDAAKVDAFLSVPLYKILHEKFAGQMLPPDTGLEAEMRSLGVAEKSSAKARQAFQRSASSAGFFATGNDRLVRPAASSRNADVSSARVEDNFLPMTSTLPESQKEVGPTDPLLIGLWSKLPSNGTFSKSQRSQWLKLAELALDMVYGEDEEETSLSINTSPNTHSNQSP